MTITPLRFNVTRLPYGLSQAVSSLPPHSPLRRAVAVAAQNVTAQNTSITAIAGNAGVLLGRSHWDCAGTGRGGAPPRRRSAG